MESLSDNISHYLDISSLFAIPAAYIAGVLISFTPCVYPIIPIQLGFIGGRTVTASSRGESQLSLKGLTLSVVFVLGMSVVYAALGAFAALTGTLFGIWASSPWTQIFVGNVILLLSLSMFGLFEIQAPQFLMRMNPKKHTGYLSAFFVGAVSGLVVGPCTAPALGATLAFVGTRGEVLFGIVVLFAFALGMGTLMVVLGTFTGALSILPKSGGWMKNIKIGFGIVMLLLAEYYFIRTGQLFI
jgi:thiol:disulfide interchange protein DsbD